MKWLRFLPAVVAIGLLAGCSTLTQNDRYMLQSHHVSPGLYTRMVDDDPLSLGDIIELSQKGVPADFIIHYIWDTRAVYRLSSNDVARLRKAGVSQRVIDYLLSVPRGYAQPYSYPYPSGAYYPYPYYPYPYGYGPTVIVGGGYYGGGSYGGGYYRRGYWH